MSEDRKRLLEGRLKAKAMLSHPSPAVRDAAKKAMDQADMALDMMDAIDRKRAAPPTMPDATV